MCDSGCGPGCFSRRELIVSSVMSEQLFSHESRLLRSIAFFAFLSSVRINLYISRFAVTSPKDIWDITFLTFLS